MEECEYESIECGERPLFGVPMNTFIPVSRFRREMNKWMRYIDNNKEDVLFITRNKTIDGVITSPEWMENIQRELTDKILNEN